MDSELRKNEEIMKEEESKHLEEKTTDVQPWRPQDADREDRKAYIMEM